jgi:putative transposase
MTAMATRRVWASEATTELSVIRRCDLVGLPRSSYYYTAAEETALNLELMRLLDEEYTRHPFYGSRRMVEWLRTQNHEVNRKRVRRLMRTMGIEAIYPKPRLSVADKEHEKYPYLLSGLAITRPNQVWSADITYVRMRRGFIYLVAIIDWYSRYVLAWETSNTLDTTFCLAALEAAMQQGQPDIFNTDQGCQFTSKNFTGALKSRKVQISMDGRGRALDNVFIERLWRSVKYEEVYLKDYVEVVDAVTGIDAYLGFYNHERPHQSLGYKTPWQVHHGLAVEA